MKSNICTLSIVLFVSVLVCTGFASKTPSGPKLWIDSKAIDLGVIAVDQQEIKGVIAYMNEGDETLEVTNINGRIKGTRYLLLLTCVVFGVIMVYYASCEAKICWWDCVSCSESCQWAGARPKKVPGTFSYLVRRSLFRQR